MTFNRYEILVKHYTNSIKQWDWDLLVKATKENCFVNEENEIEGNCYLGSVLNLYPSGKYYMPWCSNQTRADETKDECFHEALESVAGEYGLFITSGDGDGCDIFAGKIFDFTDAQDVMFVTFDEEAKALELYNDAVQEVTD